MTQPIAPTVLPLENPERHRRFYDFSACITERNTMQMRAALQDRQVPRKIWEQVQTLSGDIPLSDFSEDDTIIHEMVILWELNPKKKIIENCQIAMPRGASRFCQSLPVTGQELIGLKLDETLGDNIKKIYNGIGACVHINSLLLASIPALWQSLNFCHAFENSNRLLNEDNHKKILAKMAQAASDTCYGWQKNGDFLQNTLAGDNAELMHNVFPALYKKVYK